MSDASFVAHENAPGPRRLHTEAPDVSGNVNADIQYIADRQTIVNTITAYSHCLDEGRWEEFFALYSEDVVFETTIPEAGTIITHGKKVFREMVMARYGQSSTAVRRHTQGNVHVAEQSATSAKVRTYMLISTVPAADKLQLLTTGTYNADLEKRKGRWIITRWYIEVDTPLAKIAMPEGLSKEEIQWIPDPRQVTK